MNDLLKKRFWVVANVVWLCAPTAAVADSVTLVPSGDATIAEKYPDSPQGVFPGSEYRTLDSGTTGPNEGLLMNRALLKFDLASSIPSNAIVTGAALTLTLVKATTTTVLWFSLHKVLQDWSESVVTWTNRLSPPAPWSVPGGAAPLDYASSVTQTKLIDPISVPRSLTLLPQTNGQFQFQFNAESNRNYTAEYCSDLTTANWLTLTNFAPLPAPANVIVSDALLSDSNHFYRIRTCATYTFTSNPAMVADVQDWVSNLTNNYGWILICEREDLERSVRKFGSRETITNSPSLEVQFTLPSL